MTSKLQELEAARAEVRERYFADLADWVAAGRPRDDVEHQERFRAIEQEFDKAIGDHIDMLEKCQVHIRVEAPTIEAALSILGWTDPAVIITGRVIRSIRSGHIGVGYAVNVYGLLRNEYTEGHDE